MGTPPLPPRFTPPHSPLLAEGSCPSGSPVGSAPLSANHHGMLIALAAITPLLVLINCLDNIQGAFMAVPLRPALAMVRPIHSGLDYLGIHAKLRWAYAAPGGIGQPVRCIAVSPP